MAADLTWNAGNAAIATGGKLIYGSDQTQFDSVSIDSRTTSLGDLFVSIIGARHDGHRHADIGISRGQRGVIINEATQVELPHAKWRNEGFFCIVVKDTTRALGDLAAYRRKQAGLAVIAITGSNGKTSTRRMTSAVMAQKYCVLSTRKNFNNEIGLPLTLLQCQRQHHLAVLELGMNHFGEIRRLAEICQPKIGLITNIGPAHLEGLGSIEGVARAKGELLEHIQPDGTVILNGDDPHLMRLMAKSRNNVLLFGFSETAQVRASNVVYKKLETTFTLNLLQDKINVTLNVPGRFMVANALAAAACGHLMGLSPKEISAGLAAFKPHRQRMNIETTAARIHLIDDTYNANPASMAAALELLSHMKNKGRAIFICGDMYELGRQTEALHQALGAEAVKAGVDQLYITGRYSACVANGAIENGMPAERIFTGAKKDIISHTNQHLRPEDWVLIKGSRAMAMETISEAIRSIESIRD